MPTIQTTGSIKLAINYAPVGDSADYNDEFTTYQEILAALGDKVDKIETNVKGAYIHIGDYQGELLVDTYAISNTIPQRVSGGHVNVGLTPTSNENATSKKYVDDSIASAVSSVYKYKGSVATYDDLPSSDLTIGDVYNVEDTGDNYAWTGTTWDKLAGDIDLSGYATKDYVDTGLSGKQNTLVSGVNIKTINNNSLLGTGNIEIQASGGGAWGEITGDIQDQTDLWNELQANKEIAEGKCKTYVLSYSQTAPTTDIQAKAYKKPDGTAFTSLSDFNTYVSGLTLRNSEFNSQNAYISPNIGYIIADGTVYKIPDIVYDELFKKGDIFLVVETDVPDRWFDGAGAFYKLETSKIDLTDYATKDDLDDLVNDIVANGYDDTLTYTKGEVVEYGGKIYRAKQDISTAESWDSSHWEQVNVASDFVNLTGTQVISGVKTFTTGTKLEFQAMSNTYFIKGDESYLLAIGIGNNNYYYFSNNYFEPAVNNSKDLGTTTYKWKDLYLSGTAYINGGLQLDGSSDTNSPILTFKNQYATGEIRMSAYNFTISHNLIPKNGTTPSLGTALFPFQNLYLSGQVIGASNVFNVINASDIASDNKLTADQIAIFTNGKPTIIVGNYRGLKNAIYLSPTSLWAYAGYYGTVIGATSTSNSADNFFSAYRIEESGLISVDTNVGNRIKLVNIGSFNGKSVPTYPANANWKGEWYGTQAEYDALSSYDSNTTYYILES